MSTLAIRWIAILLTFALSVSAASAVSGSPCGNNDVGGNTASGSTVPSDTTPTDTTSLTVTDCSEIQPTPPRTEGDPVIPYTGNEYQEIEDLALWGSVGRLPIRWLRRANSRTVGGASLFGMAHYWRHNFQWDLFTTAADDLGRARLTLIYPDGAQFIFTETSSGTWTSNQTLTDRLQPTKDGFVLQRKDASRYFFRSKLSGGTVHYIMEKIQDDASNIYTLTYDAARKVTKVTEPAGRHIRVSYCTLSGNNLNVTTLATLDIAPRTNQWVEFTITNANAYRYAWALQADLSFGNIAEIELYEAGTNARLTGGVICSDSLAKGRAAFDGNPATGFISAAASGGFVGYDLGAPKQIGRVRFLSVAGKESAHMPGGWAYERLKIQGANETMISTDAISKVETSDGRSVLYQYTSFVDPRLPYVFPVLRAAIYGDGTRAEYKYIQVFPGSRPLISEWDDPRKRLPQPRYKTVYQDERTGRALGAVTAQVNLETGGSIVELGIAGSLNKPMVTFANGAMEIQVYDSSPPTGARIMKDITANNNTNTYTYDAHGYMATKTDSLNRTTSYIWTPTGNLLSITHADGSRESWIYNDVSLVLSYTDALDRVTSYTRDSSNRVTRIDRPDGSYETFAYNAFGQRVSHRQRKGGIETFTYDARGLLTTKTDPLGKVTTYSYDAHDRLASTTDADGHSTLMEYDERGLVTKTTRAGGSYKRCIYNKYGDVLTETDELGQTWTYTRDVFCRVTSLTDPLGRTATAEYLADSYVDKPLSQTSPSGRKTVFTYDKAWNTLSVTVDFGTAEAATTKYTYNTADKVITTTDPQGKTTTYAYDVRDRRISATDPLGCTTEWRYDLVGNVVSVTRPDGSVTTNVYDTMNVLIWTGDRKSQDH